METRDKASVQDSYLTEAKDKKTPVVIFMMNGFQMKGVVSDFDDFTILFESDGKQQLIYKHAVSTVAPQIEKSQVRRTASAYCAW